MFRNCAKINRFFFLLYLKLWPLATVGSAWVNRYSGQLHIRGHPNQVIRGQNNMYLHRGLYFENISTFFWCFTQNDTSTAFKRIGLCWATVGSSSRHPPKDTRWLTGASGSLENTHSSWIKSLAHQHLPHCLSEPSRGQPSSSSLSA